MTGQQRVVIAMSGGVDSSVAAALLQQAGYDVVGMMLSLWNEPGKECANRCCTPDDMAQARRVAAILGIPFYAIDARELFRQEVVGAFLKGYTAGQTPNPCIVCNRKVRWGFLLQQAQMAGADFLATGHYARIERGEDGSVRLLRGLDPHKDQSYVLSGLNQAQLKATLLPLGDKLKPHVRELARQLGLPVAERADSQDLCFLGQEDYRSFLARYAPETVNPGPIVDRQNRILGQHQGLAAYTIGQRKALGISSAVPLYVLEKYPESNTLVVGVEEELGCQVFEAGEMNWINGDPQEPFTATVKIRYKAKEALARVIPLSDSRVRIELNPSLRDVTAGQRVVIYQDDLCLGGGTIQ